MNHHLLFEGAELAGKSWLMSRIYARLEPKYRQSRDILDGCHWFNADVGVFGTPAAEGAIKGYLQIFAALKERNVLVEKFHIADAVYNEIYHGRQTDHGQIENELKGLGFKIVLVTFPEEEAVLSARLRDRLRLYPHYERIKHAPDWYIRQQRLCRRHCAASALPVLEVPTVTLPDEKAVKDILDWIGE